jgi:hypothetical protein
VEGYSHVTYLAGFISNWKRDAESLMMVNRDGAGSVAEACRKMGISE